MGFDITPLMKDMTDNQRLMFLNEYNNQRKKTSTCYIFLIFLGGLGGHHYYMGNIIVGLLYTVFVWTGIPLILAFIELFLAWMYVENHNKKVAYKIEEQIKSLP